jgi:hypothetical protein
MKPGTTSADTVATRRQALITLSQGLSLAPLIDTIYFLVAGVATQIKDQKI